MTILYACLGVLACCLVSEIYRDRQVKKRRIAHLKRVNAEMRAYLNELGIEG